MDKEILHKLRCGICAVGYLDISIEEYIKNPYNAKSFYIEGTGFLVRENTIMTNRHVITNLRNAIENGSIPEEQRFLQFVYPRENGWQTALCGIEFASTLNYEDVDVGFIDFDRRPDKEFAQCQPLELTEDLSLTYTGQSIGMFGYPEGNELLVNRFIDDMMVYRFGPILQQGCISAIAPFDGNPPISRILSDIKTLGGMSGSPVFHKETGKVLSIHEGSNMRTTAFSVPLFKNEVAEWLETHDQMRRNLESQH